MTRMRQEGRVRRAVSAASLALLFQVPASLASNHAYVIERGEVRISGETNVYPFSGTSRDFEGCVRPKGADLFQGDVRVAMRSFTFDIPFASIVIESETQFDVARFPYVKLRLDDLYPVPGHQRLKGGLELRGVRLPVEMAVDVSESSTGIVVGGTMQLRQSDFGVTPFDWGVLRVADEVSIAFEAAFRRVEAASLAMPSGGAVCPD